MLNIAYRIISSSIASMLEYCGERKFLSLAPLGAHLLTQRICSCNCELLISAEEKSSAQQLVLL